MLLNMLISQLGSTGMLDTGWGGVQNAVHISFGGLTKIFHPRKKHLPVAALEPLRMDVMTIPLCSSTSRFVAVPVYSAPGLFPATVFMPSKSEKLSRYLPVRALIA